MANPFYNHTDGVPANQSRGVSALIRNEFDLVGTGFNLVAPIASPAFTGAPTAPTASSGTNTTQIATTAFVIAQGLTSALPGQAGNAGKYITTNGVLASWADLIGVTQATADNSTNVATTAYVVNRIAQDAPTKAGVGATGSWNITANKATYIDGGTAGQIPYQTGVGITGFIPVGTASQILISGGAGAPSWMSTVPIASGGTNSSTAAGARANLSVAPRATRIDVATVAGTVDLTANAPDTDDIQFTGSNAMTGFTVAVGRVIRFVVATGASPSLVSGAAINTQTGANVPLSPGDSGVLRATAANTVELIGFSPAVRSKLVQATYDTATASGTQTITGAGFTPGSVQVTAVKTATAQGSWDGMSDGTSQCCIYTNQNAVPDTLGVSPTNVIYILQSPGNLSTATIAFNSDGCVLTWTKTGLPTGVASLALLFKR